MPTIPYKDSKGKRLPGCTTIIANLGWSKDALIYWSWNEGREGRDYRQTRDNAADLGTLLHLAVESDIHGRPWPHVPEEHKDKFDNGMLGWLHWKDMVKFSSLMTEVSLVDEILGYGGTLDLMGIMGRATLGDLKTSKGGVYPEFKIQIASYGHLWRNAQWQVIDGKLIPWKMPYDFESYAILQIGKDDASFHYHSYQNLDEAWEVFKCLLTIHNLKKILK